jgi:hypothetical protein
MTTQEPPSQLGCEWVEECIETCRCRSVNVDENGVQAWFRNQAQEEIRKIHYDGCYEEAEGTQKADFILGLPDVIDVVIELKGSHTNLGHAYEQIVDTIEAWRLSPIRYPRIAALIIYGTIWARDRLPRRRPKARSSAQTVLGDFRKHFHGKILLQIHESGEKQFTFNEFLRKNDTY